MDWRDYPTEWRSLVWDHELPQHVLPLEFVTPELAWDYGAISRVLSRPSEGESSVVLKVRARVSEGRVGVSVSKTNGSALVSREIPLTPEQGEVEIYFELPAGKRPLSLLVRNYDDDGRRGQIKVIDVKAIALAEFDEALKSQLALSTEA